MSIGDIVGEPLKVQGGRWPLANRAVEHLNSGTGENARLRSTVQLSNDREDIRLSSVEARVAALLSKVGLSPECMNRYPHEFSGGQRQRIGVARALVLKPRLVICDEPVSSLDVSIQAQILNLLKDLQEEFALTYLFIAHDLAVVEFFCDIVAVMYMGRIVEQSEAEQLYRNPLHPYTQELMWAIPQVEPAFRGRKTAIGGEVPSPSSPPVVLRRAGILSPPHVWWTSPPTGCPFHPRCPLAEGDCLKEMPILEEKSKGHFVACGKCKKN
jgi:ABC-type dipeptide/oligopeptide/nickel transport system ATPase component